jgi:hypothetical protein
MLMKSFTAIVLLLMIALIYVAEPAFAEDGGSDQAAWIRGINCFLMSCQEYPCCAANISNITGANPCLNLNNSTASCPSCCEQFDGCGKKFNASLY